VKPSESLCPSEIALRCDGGGPGGGCTSDKSGNSFEEVPLAVFGDLPGTTSEMSDGSRPKPLICDAGLRVGGDSAREESLLSWEDISRRLFVEARGDGIGRPSLLPDCRPNDGKVFEGDGARPNPP